MTKQGIEEYIKMVKEKIYLDTSIPSAYYDTTKPLRQLITQKWFEKEASRYALNISTLTVAEIDETSDERRRQNIKELIKKYKCSLIEVTDEMLSLSNNYMKCGAIPKSEPEDALHVAIATVSGIEMLASWNFSHIVSINPIRKIQEINIKNKYYPIQIGSLEIFGGAKYGNL